MAKMTEFLYYSLSKARLARGTVVVIDVLRAFTTAAFAFEAGATQIYPVSTIEEAFQLKKQLPNTLVMGEVDGYRPSGFDFGNSPAKISKQNLKGKRLIQRTSAGTQGIIKAVQADQLLAASFVVAKATADKVQEINPKKVSFIVTGESLGRDGEEDRACGEYIQALIQGHDPDSRAYTRRVLTSSVGLTLKDGHHPTISQEDFALSLAVNRFPFAIILTHRDSHVIMEKEWIRRS